MIRNNPYSNLERVIAVVVLGVVFFALGFCFHVQVDKWRHDELRKRIELLEAKQ